MMLNRDRIFRTITTLDTFVNHCLNLKPRGPDYTDEDFYGAVQGFWIHGWTGRAAVMGMFKFLSCALVGSDIPQRIPLISIPIPLGHNMATEVCFCLSLLQSMVRSIKLVLFDCGFYSKELMLTLAKIGYPDLIFVPKNGKVKRELAEMAVAERKKIHYEFTLNKDKTILRGRTTLALLKKISSLQTGRAPTGLLPPTRKRSVWSISFLRTRGDGELRQVSEFRTKPASNRSPKL
jgi:hypothetical protein